MTNYDLYNLLKEELGNGSFDLVTRPSGNKIRERIKRDIKKEDDGAVIALDFSKIGIVDYSCADEIFDVKEASTGAKYLVINESKKVGESHEHNRIMIFQEDIQSFSEGLQKVVGFIQK